MNKLDEDYKQLLLDVSVHGTDSDDRTGVGTRSIFGAQIEIPLTNEDGEMILPAITLRKVAPRWAFEELMFMLNGKTQTKELSDKKVRMWEGNTTREFLDNRGLDHLEEGDMGKMYGSQLREFFGSNYPQDPPQNFIIDQLIYMVNEIKNNPSSRRIIATHYNPAESQLGVLFPCHIMTQFNVRGEYLDCLFWMRSSDVGFGLPMNLMYYGMFCHLMAKMNGLKAGNLVYQSGDCHIYNDQLDCGMIDYMIGNESKKTPTMKINTDITDIKQMLNLTWDDISIDYDTNPDFDNKPVMAV